MIASDFEINFPYGATDAPYSPTHPHRGDDRPCPVGTPVVIEGVSIGLTGATGFVSGPHLHIQEWQSDYANTRKPQNAFVPGKVVNIDPDGTQGDGSFGKFITIQTADGWNDTYCHLSQINVSVGQVIGDEMDEITLAQQNALVLAQTGDYPGPGFNGYVGNPGTQENWDKLIALVASLPRGPKLDTAPLQAQIDQLTAANLKLTDQLAAVRDQATVPSPAPTDPDSVTVTKDGFWQALLRFLGKG